MKQFNPTHFIEQYNPREEYKDVSNKQFEFTLCLPLEHLPSQLQNTKDCITLKTVAIFKIQFKQS